MRVLVHGLVGTNMGGIETFLLNMNDTMSDNCIFDYVIEEKECIHEDRIHKKGGRIYKIASRSENVMQHLRDIIKLYIKLRSEYDVTYFNLSSASWILPELLAKFMKYRVVIHSHNAMLIDTNNSFLYRVVNHVNRFILGHMRIERLACSKMAASFLFGNAEFIMIYNGINVDKYKFSLVTRELIRSKCNIEKDAFVIGVVGRLAYQKNPLFTIEIFKNVLKYHPDARLMFIGNGNLKQEIIEKIHKLKIEKRVILTGIVDNVNEFLSAFDMFLLPSRHEGLGIALVEAQANGLKCLTSKDVVPIEVEVTDLIKFKSLSVPAIDWAEAILDVSKSLNNRSDYNEILKKSKFDIFSVAKKLEGIIRKIEL